MAEGWREVLSAYRELHSEAEEYRALDEERLLVLARTSGRGRASGLELPEAWSRHAAPEAWSRHAAPEAWSRHAALFHIQDAKVTRLTLYWHPDRAFADLGLTTEGDPQ